MVASTDELASRVGVDLLSAGGNAVDAAIGTALALAVVNPEAGNLGGSGFALVRTAGGDHHALDFRSTAPGRATRDMFLDADGELTERSEVGPLAVAVPGSVRGLYDLHARLGRRPWEEVVEPAVGLARGFEVGERLTRSYPDHIIELMARFPETAGIFLPGGAPPRRGTTFRQPDLARTLERIRDQGADGFYHGEVAERIEAAMAEAGGILTAEDLAAYRAEWRRPLLVPYRDHVLVSMPPSSSGGVTVALAARALEHVDVAGLEWHGSDHVHVLAEAWSRAFADRNHELADPAFHAVPMDTLLDPGYGRWRGRNIRPDGRATPAVEAGPGVAAWREGGHASRRGAGAASEGDHTTHLSVVDAEGAAVALTTTLNTWYGSKFVAAGTGVLLNNDMDDLSARPGTPNHFGLIQGEANAVEPGKRPLSAMTPTLVLDADGALRLVVGNAGGATIITTVFQIVSNVVDHGMDAAAAVAAPRVHHQHLPDRVQYEPGGLDAEVVVELERRGHAMAERGEMSGDAHVVAVRADGLLEGVADPRRGGVAVGR